MILYILWVFVEFYVQKLLIADSSGNEWLLWRYSDQPSRGADTWCSIGILVRKDDGHALTIRRAQHTAAEFLLYPRQIWQKAMHHCEQVSFGCTYLTLLGASVRVFRHIEGQQVKWIRMGIVTQREGPAEKIRGSIACWKVQGGFAKACWICNWVTPSSVLVSRIVWQTCQAFQRISTASQLCVLLLDLRLPPIHSNTDEAFVLKLVLSHNDWKICRVCHNHYQSLSPLGWCPSQAA